MVLLMTEEVEEKRIVTEFCHLLEKSKQLFNGLRDLPLYGHKQWQAYFSRTFDIYTKLWKFQQQHRPTLDRIYCLKRWQIGEIASKIGQLYYHYYLRTSELAYLNEAGSFYGAIRARGYYNKKEERNEFLVKKLRYLARFILVCLLLKKMKLAKELVQELSDHVADYSKSPMYEPEDHLEWTLVLNEIVSFLQAEGSLRIVVVVPEDEDCSSDDDEDHHHDHPVHVHDQLLFVPNYRLVSASQPTPQESATGATSSTSASASAVGSGLSLQEILVVCTKADQIKFSEFTLDMYRMLQTLERESTGAGHHHNGIGGGSVATRSAAEETSLVEDHQGQGQGQGQSDDQLANHNNAATATANSDTHTIQIQTQQGAGASCSGSGATDKINPHKHLLYKPNLEQLLVHISCSWKCLGSDGVLLLYISGDVAGVPNAEGRNMNGDDSGVVGTNPFRPRPIAIAPTLVGYESGGISTATVPVAASKKETDDQIGRASANANANAKSTSKCQRKDKQCLYPGDLVPFTRKPLFLIIDSDNSHVFNELCTNPFGTPLLILMSPMELPAFLQGTQSSGGSLLTHFLYSPLSAFASITQINSISSTKWNIGQDIIAKFMVEAGRLFLEIDNLTDPSQNQCSPNQIKHNSTLEFFTDEFLRLLLLRFVFCDMILRVHKAFQCSTRFFPRSQPNIATQLQRHNDFQSLQLLVVELCQFLSVSQLFNLELSHD